MDRPVWFGFNNIGFLLLPLLSNIDDVAAITITPPLPTPSSHCHLTNVGATTITIVSFTPPLSMPLPLPSPPQTIAITLSSLPCHHPTLTLSLQPLPPPILDHPHYHHHHHSPQSHTHTITTTTTPLPLSSIMPLSPSLSLCQKIILQIIYNFDTKVNLSFTYNNIILSLSNKLSDTHQTLNMIRFYQAHIISHLQYFLLYPFLFYSCQQTILVVYNKSLLKLLYTSNLRPSSTKAFKH